MPRYGKGKLLHHNFTKTSLLHPKPTIMLSHPLITRLLIFGFMVLVGTSMAANIQAKNLLGFFLSLISLGAGVYVIHLLQKLRESREKEETN